MPPSWPIAAIFCLSFCVEASAASALPAEPLAKIGALLFSDDFERTDLGASWRAGVHAFTVADGALKGSQRRADHGAVGAVAVGFKDAIIEFKSRLEGAASFHAVCDDKAYQGSHAGHICRVAITPKLIRLGDDKEGGMRNDIVEMKKDPARKAGVARLLADRNAAFPATIEQGRWYRLRLEIVDDQMRVSLDGKPVGALRSPGIAHPTKSHFPLTVTGKDALFDEVRIWRAERETGAQ